MRRIIIFVKRFNDVAERMRSTTNRMSSPKRLDCALIGETSTMHSASPKKLS